MELSIGNHLAKDAQKPIFLDTCNDVIGSAKTGNWEMTHSKTNRGACEPVYGIQQWKTPF
jgi:hypothetical protein